MWAASRSRRPSHILRRSVTQRSIAWIAGGWMKQVRTRPFFSLRIRPALSRMPRCLVKAGRAIACGCASSLTDAGPSRRCSTTARRVGSPRAWKLVCKYLSIWLSYCGRGCLATINLSKWRSFTFCKLRAPSAQRLDFPDCREPAEWAPSGHCVSCVRWRTAGLVISTPYQRRISVALWSGPTPSTRNTSPSELAVRSARIKR